MLPFSKSQTGASTCNPTAAGTYVDCLTLNVDGSTGFPRKYYIAFDGTFDGIGSNGSAPTRAVRPERKSLSFGRNRPIYDRRNDLWHNRTACCSSQGNCTLTG